MSRILPRFTQEAIEHDPLEIMLAQHEAKQQAAIARINNGAPMADPSDLRGIPCLAKGVGGTSPHTDPLKETIHRNRMTSDRRRTLYAG